MSQERRKPGTDDLTHSLLAQAVHCAEEGNHAMAIAVADAAARIAVTGRDCRVDTAAWEDLRPMIEAVVLRGADATADLAVAVVATARALADLPVDAVDPASG